MSGLAGSRIATGGDFFVSSWFHIDQCSRKVHDVFGTLVDGDCAQHGGCGAVLWPGRCCRRQERALPRVVLLLDEVVASPEGDELGVVRWCWNAN